MKISLFLILISAISLHAGVIYSQNMTIDMQNVTVREVINEIEKEGRISFLFNDNHLELNRKVSVSHIDSPIRDILFSALDQADMMFEEVGENFLVLIPKPAQLEQQGITVKGRVTDASTGGSLPGASIMVQGTTIGTVTDIDGNYSLEVPGPDAVLIFSYVGYVRQTVVVGDQRTINISLAPDFATLDEVVVVGYGTQKRINLTGAVSALGSEEIENRPISNVQQALQGLVPNLIILPTAAGGEPGASMSMNIRGLSSFEGSTNPYVLVDGIPMGINDVNPNDIESISVLKDAASTAIYGARAAHGVILITTKKGQAGARASYSMNIARSTPTIWPELVPTLDYVHVINEARTNVGGTPHWDEAALDRIRQNRDNPGSAPSLMPLPGDQNWDVWSGGLRSSGYEDWESLIVNRWAPVAQHNMNVSGGTDAINYYFSASYFDEKGLLKIGNESYNRYNLDAKIEAQATPWLRLSMMTKYRHGHEDFPWDPNYGRAWIMNWIGKIKPTMPAKYDGTDIWTLESGVGAWENNREYWTRKQLVIAPKITLEPIKNWITNIELNYIENNNQNSFTYLQRPWLRPDGEVVYDPATRESTRYHNNLYHNEYLSPNVYSTYTNSFGRHNLNLLAGFQQEVYRYNNMVGQGNHLLSDAIPSISTAVGEKQITDNLGHWGTTSYFSRVNYNFDERYMFEVNVRGDGSSRFDTEERWGTFPSFSAGWVLSNETFFPEINQLDDLKIRASYGTLGNQNVANYLYVPGLPVRQNNRWIFGNERAWVVGAPSLASVNLTWEKVQTMNFGLDVTALGNRLGILLDIYESRTKDLVGPGEALPAALGTAVPKRNDGEIQTRGWEVELSWKNRVNRDFSYGVRGVLSDYKSTVENYNNPNNLLNTYYNGMVLGEIWGFRTDGLFQTEEEIDNYPYDLSFIWGGRWRTGDVKYLDLNGDGVINIGGNSVDDPGDREVIGNSTPRYLFGLSGNVSWKNFDASVLFQGVGKRDIWIGSANPFRGPASGPFHAMVYKEHMDYFRDETSLFGPNPDAYFARPYSQFMGENAKNYQRAHDRFLQDASFVRLKNFTIGYTLPASIAQKTFINNARIYLSGENLLTFTNLMIFDPEAFGGRWYGAGDAYPLSKTYSLGLTVNF